MGWSIYERQPEEDLFRRMPSGWVFTVGGRWRYLVDDSQKAELLARLGRWRFVSFLFLAAILGASVLISGALARPGGSRLDRFRHCASDFRLDCRSSFRGRHAVLPIVHPPPHSHQRGARSIDARTCPLRLMERSVRRLQASGANLFVALSRVCLLALWAR